MKYTNPVKPTLGISAIVIAALASMPGHAADYSAFLTANPTNYSGKCPAVITFKGFITAKKAGRVQYKFIRSDNAAAPIQTLEFAAPGTKPVSTTWTLGGAALPNYSGWQAIQIVYPTNVTFNKAGFTVRCAVAPPKPEITGYKMPGPNGTCVPKGTHFTILGRHFGSQIGKGIALGGHGISVDLQAKAWSNSHIVAFLPYDRRIQENQWYYTGIQLTNPRQWLSNISKNITVCPSRK